MKSTKPEDHEVHFEKGDMVSFQLGFSDSRTYNGIVVSHSCSSDLTISYEVKVLDKELDECILVFKRTDLKLLKKSIKSKSKSTTGKPRAIQKKTPKKAPLDIDSLLGNIVSLKHQH